MSAVPKLSFALSLVFQSRSASSPTPLTASLKIRLLDSIKTTLGSGYLLASHDLIEAKEDDLARVMGSLRSKEHGRGSSAGAGTEISKTISARSRDTGLAAPTCAGSTLAAAQAALEAAAHQLQELVDKQQPNPFRGSDLVSKALLRIAQFADQCIPFSAQRDQRDMQKTTHFQETWKSVKEDLAHAGYEATPAFNKSGLFFKGIRLNPAIPEHLLPYDQDFSYASSFDQSHKQYFLRIQKRWGREAESRGHRERHSLKRRRQLEPWESVKKAKLETRVKD